MWCTASCGTAARFVAEGCGAARHRVLDPSISSYGYEYLRPYRGASQQLQRAQTFRFLSPKQSATVSCECEEAGLTQI